MSMLINEVIDHIRNRTYMGGIERDQLRVKATGEVFTPTSLVQDILGKMLIEQFTDSTKTFLDNSCGDGQFLGEVLIRKMENGSTFEQALSTIYGVDLMIDNVDLCRERLLCGREDLRHIVEKNIQCKNGLTYGYKFEAMGPARRKTEEQLRNKEKKLQLKKQKEEELRIKKEEQEKIVKKLFKQSIESKNMSKNIDPEKLLSETVETRNKIDTVKKVKLNNPKVVNKKQQTNEPLISLQAQLKG